MLRHIGPWLGGGCPSCPSSFPAPYITLPGSPFGGGCAPPFEPPVISLPGPPIDIGQLVSFNPVVFEMDARWLAASEPDEWLPQDRVVLMALDPDLAPELAFGRSSQGLELVGDTPPDCAPNCDNPPPPILTVAGRSPAVTECIPVLSAREGSVYVLAGDEDTRAGSVHVRNATHDTYGERFDAALGAVLAATYRPHDRSLYVLDVVRTGRGWRARRHARLVRLAVDLPGPTEVLARWPRLSWNTRFQLVSDTAGALWILASPDRGPHVVLRFELERHRRHERWRTTGWRLGDGALSVATPTSSALGISYVVERHSQEERVGLRVGDLWPAGRGAHRRCF